VQQGVTAFLIIRSTVFEWDNEMPREYLAGEVEMIVKKIRLNIRAQGVEHETHVTCARGGLMTVCTD
jgi:hypothetical protein